ncbi:MAG: hypothetical protein V5A68_06580 [Candidatus Thermoplasmatota archaeon]
MDQLGFKTPAGIYVLKHTEKNKSGLEITYINGGSSNQINYGVKNIGKRDLKDIQVFMKITGGIILTGRTYTEEITANLEPGEEANRFFYPVLGIGFATQITFSVWTENIDTVNKTVDAFFLSPFYIYIRPGQYR